ncbi:hypothetical protein DVH24_012211 [Malus domestica]|uniref:Uncharacterized protein n=1 Tax=Malus domestica TaxID=3750 RepID=A0A498HST6_MALDO|nr:hypothetical protein DVH24_012211 [Malus domestica]
MVSSSTQNQKLRIDDDQERLKCLYKSSRPLKRWTTVHASPHHVSFTFPPFPEYSAISAPYTPFLPFQLLLLPKAQSYTHTPHSNGGFTISVGPSAPTQSETESPMSSIVYVISQQVQGAMENMFKMTSEIDENSAGISEEIEKCKESAIEKKKDLEEVREQVEKAAYAVLELLNNRA